MSKNRNSKSYLSIIIPCYNQGIFLEECLSSIYNQTVSNWECIIIDDGSTDDSKNIALRWIEKDSRFKYYYKENGGLSSARNFGIKHAKHPYILPLDADDKIHETLIEEVYRILQNENYDLISYDVQLFGTKNKKLQLPKYSYKTLLLQNCFIACSIFKKELWTEAEGYDENLKSFEDWDFWIRALNHKSKVYHIPKVLYFYRKHRNGSLTNTFKSNPKYYFGLYDYVYTKNKSIYQENFPNPILAYQENEALRKFNGKVKNTFFFRLYTIFKRIIKK